MLFTRRKPANNPPPPPDPEPVMLCSSPNAVAERWYVLEQYRDDRHGEFWVARAAGHTGDVYFDGARYGVPLAAAKFYPRLDDLKADMVGGARREESRAMRESAPAVPAAAADPDEDEDEYINIDEEDPDDDEDDDEEEDEDDEDDEDDDPLGDDDDDDPEDLAAEGGPRPETPRDRTAPRGAVPAVVSPAAPAPAPPTRHRLPDTRPGCTHHFEIDGHDGYVTVGFYPDGRLGEVFVKVSKQGSTISGLMDSVAIATSIGLQYGVPLETYCRKFAFSKFEPAGFTRNPDVRIAKSVVDYVFRWLGAEFVPGFRAEFCGAPPTPPPVTYETSFPLDPPFRAAEPQPEKHTVMGVDLAEPGADRTVVERFESDAVILAGHQAVTRLVAAGGNGNGRAHSDCPPCRVCGALTFRAGSCFSCSNCGSTSGCG